MITLDRQEVTYIVDIIARGANPHTGLVNDIRLNEFIDTVYREEYHRKAVRELLNKLIDIYTIRHSI